MTAGAVMAQLGKQVASCTACPRLVAWRQEVALVRRAQFADQTYWGRPVPGYGDPKAEVLVVGLAPAAHGGNRTGRVFTGDRSGDWLFRAMWRAGFANQPTSVTSDDGLELKRAWVTAAVKCAPPLNRPTTDERDRCISFLMREISLLSQLRVVVALGQFAWSSVCMCLELTPRPKFTHGAEVELVGQRWLLGSFHPSQQNTFTGKLTEQMLDSVFERARWLIGP